MSGFAGGKLTNLNPILNVTQLDASISFYTEVLGLELYHTFGDPPDFAIVGRDGLQIYLCENGQGIGETWLAFFVENLVSMIGTLKAKGVEISQPFGGNEFHIKDPDGHVFRIMQ